MFSPLARLPATTERISCWTSHVFGKGVGVLLPPTSQLEGVGVLLPQTSQLEGVRPSRARYQQPGKSVSAICDVTCGMLQHTLSGKWKED